jgi:flavin reductase (DIM6/NTAB) family NADH-FMN oxidoreductase RutF
LGFADNGNTADVAVSGTEAFEQLVSLLDYPVFVVTAQAQDTVAGCLVGFAGQVSIDPPRFQVGLSRRNHTFRIAEHATHLGVHVFDREQLDVVALFGSQSGDTCDKFDRCAWHPGPEQTPILDDAAAWFVGRILKRFSFGDHVGHLLEPVVGEPPLESKHWVSFADVRDLQPGKPV